MSPNGNLKTDTATKKSSSTTVNFYYEVTLTEQLNTKCLADQEKSILLSDLKHHIQDIKKRGYNPQYCGPYYQSSIYNRQSVSNDNNKSVAPNTLQPLPTVISRCKTWPDNTHVINPSDNTVLQAHDGGISLSLINYALTSDFGAWKIFNSDGVEINIKSHNIQQDSPKYSVINQQFSIKLLSRINIGFVQFIQERKSGLTNSFGQFPYGSILTLFVHYNFHNITHFDPPFIVCPIRHNHLYVFNSTTLQAQIIAPMHLDVKERWPYNQTSQIRLRHFCNPVSKQQILFYKKQSFIKQGQILDLTSKMFDVKATVYLDSVDFNNASKVGIAHICNPPQDFEVRCDAHVDTIQFHTINPIRPVGVLSNIDKMGNLIIISNIRDQNTGEYIITAKLTKSTGYMRVQNLYHAQGCLVDVEA